MVQESILFKLKAVETAKRSKEVVAQEVNKVVRRTQEWSGCHERTGKSKHYQTEEDKTHMMKTWKRFCPDRSSNCIVSIFTSHEMT